jgi:hypothetical protein
MAPAKGGEESLKGVSETLFFELVQAQKICCTLGGYPVQRPHPQLALFARAFESS